MSESIYTLRRTGLSDSETDFQFFHNGRASGRTYLDKTPIGENWYWSIYGINLRGPLPEGVSVQGQADDLEAAKVDFKVNFEKLLAAGNVKPIDETRRRARLEPPAADGR